MVHRSDLAEEQLDDLLAAGRSPRSLDEQVEQEDGAVGSFGDLLQEPLAKDAYGQVLESIQGG